VLPGLVLVPVPAYVRFRSAKPAFSRSPALPLVRGRWLPLERGH